MISWLRENGVKSVAMNRFGHCNETSQIGTDMIRFPIVKAFASWLGLCPGNKISGGKILSSKTNLTTNLLF